jgi:hypothetical protein
VCRSPRDDIVIAIPADIRQRPLNTRTSGQKSGPISASRIVHRTMKRTPLCRHTPLRDLAGDRATVRLTPGRIARLFGAREAEVVSGWRGLQGEPVRGPERWDDGSLRWRFAATGRPVRHAQRAELILRALEQVPVVALARATLTDRQRDGA